MSEGASESALTVSLSHACAPSNPRTHVRIEVRVRVRFRVRVSCCRSLTCSGVDETTVMSWCRDVVEWTITV